MDFAEKLEKEKKRLINLNEQRQIIDEKIKKTENKIQEYTNLVKQQKFNEVTDVLSAKGLSIEEILKAVQSGDMYTLQERIEEKEKEKEARVNTATTLE